ncbi:MAG: invasin domain 3-containing protein [Candidatus Krumholzibacteriia bacterium]
MNRVLRATALSLALLLVFASCDKEEGGGIVDPPMAQPVLTAEAISPALAADGTSTTTVIAILVDGSGQPIGGVTVHFSTTLGTIDEQVSTNSNGEARATLQSAAQTGTARVTARYGSDLVAVATVLFIERAPGLTLTAGAEEILADGVASTWISALVTDAFGHPIAPGTEVQFTTSRGVLSDVQPIDASGNATVRLSAKRHETGLARITARAAGYQDIVDVAFVSEAASNIVLVEMERAHIGVRGSGDNETSTLVYEVRDRNGIPVDETHAVTVAFSLLPTLSQSDATVHPASGLTNDLGLVATTVNAGTISGAVLVTATSGAVASWPIRVAIHGGLPDAEHFSIAFTRINIAGLVYYDEQTEVVAHIGDIYGNPVPKGTTTWFSCDYGIVFGSAGTDSLGRSRVLHYSAAPSPQIPGGDGLVPVHAQTMDRNGELISVTSRVMWSGRTIVEILSPADGFSLPSGQTQTISYRVRDANFNPLTAGTTITVETNLGELGGETTLVLPDTQSPEYTSFEATLTRGDDDPGPVTVTVRVVSRNGDRSASVSGTLQ